MSGDDEMHGLELLVAPAIELHGGFRSSNNKRPWTYHPPGSATATSCASLTRASSNPFSDMAVYRLGRQLGASSATAG